MTRDDWMHDLRRVDEIAIKTGEAVQVLNEQGKRPAADAVDDLLDCSCRVAFAASGDKENGEAKWLKNLLMVALYFFAGQSLVGPSNGAEPLSAITSPPWMPFGK